MKRFWLDVSVIFMGIALLVCIIAIPQGVLPLLPLLGAIIALGGVMRLACARSAQLEQQALAAKRAKRLRILRAKRQRAARLAQAAAQNAPAPCAHSVSNLYVA